jgi:hypothetical protein
VVRNNRYTNANMGMFSENKLCRKSGTQVAFNRKPNTRDQLKDRALARGLVTTDYDLRQRDIVADTLRAEGID